MKEERQLIADTLTRLLRDKCEPSTVDAAEAGEWPGELWQALTDTGLTLAGISANAGGAGGEPGDSLLVLRQAAKFAAPVPLAEHYMSALLMQEAGATLASDRATLAEGNFKLTDGKLEGEASGVAFARWCRHILLVANAADGRKLCLAPRESLTIAEKNNLAGEPRDDIKAAGAEAIQIVDAPQQVAEFIHRLGAATRTAMMSGALESVLELSVQYVQERKQFGRPLAKFQAIQQQLAVLAGEVAAASMAAHALEGAFPALDEVEIALGKARVGEAVAQATDIAHQVHGAMGYTLEHPLNHRSRRLWAWRDEYGAEFAWQQTLGRVMLAGGADELWHRVTARN
ncbi:MAG: acyl-CoA dehydrogenase family protein [Pseudomonadales bacterium]